MKIYQFKELCICITICVAIISVCLSVFIYGVIWLEGWQKIDETLDIREKSILKQIEPMIQDSGRKIEIKLRNEFIPSAFKGQLSGGSRRK